MYNLFKVQRQQITVTAFVRVFNVIIEPVSDNSLITLSLYSSNFFGLQGNNQIMESYIDLNKKLENFDFTLVQTFVCKNYFNHFLFFALIIACGNRTQSPALFQNIFKFSTFLSKFSNILPFLIIFALFLKNSMHTLNF